MKRDTSHRMRKAFVTGVFRPLRAAGATRGQTTTLSRRCFTAARSSASELLKSCTSRCAAAPNGVAGKTKSPVGLRTHRAWNSVVLGVWPYGPPPLPGVRARFVSGWPKCKRASPRADIESMLAQTQYGRPLRPAMARGVASVLRVVELMTRSRRIPSMLNADLA